VREGERTRVEHVGRPPPAVVRPVIRPGLDEADAPIGVLAQARGEDATRRAAAEHQDVESLANAQTLRRAN
jgi:hypothetical protein